MDPKRLSLPVIILGAAIAASPIIVQAQVPVAVATNQAALLTSSDPKLAANKKLVYDFWREVFIGGQVDKVPNYMAEGYIQHNPAVPTGREAFVRFVTSRPKAATPATIPNLVTIRAEGDLVILAFKRDLPEPADPSKTYTSTWFDMFRIENGKIAEHWDYGTKAAPAAAPKT